MFVNTLTANDKYSLLTRDSLRQSIQMRLSQKQQKFSSLFLRASKLVSTFNIFKKNMTLIADIFPKFRTLENMVRSMSKKSRFRIHFEKQDGKRFQTVLKP